MESPMDTTGESSEQSTVIESALAQGLPGESSVDPPMYNRLLEQVSRSLSGTAATENPTAPSENPSSSSSGAANPPEVNVFVVQHFKYNSLKCRTLSY